MKPTLPSIGVLAAATAATLTYATVSPASQLFGPTLLAPRRPNELALTFDDGPNPTATPRLLDLLQLHNVKATFFLIGRYALREPALARRIAAEGHTLGNHTMTHPRLPLCSHARIMREFTSTQHAIEDTTGAHVHLFRPPFGNRSPYVLRAARALGLTPVLWNLIANDWKLPSAEAITSRLQTGIALNHRHNLASNIVLHDGSQTTLTADRLRTVAATAALIEIQTAQNARFVTLDTWLT